MSVRKRTRTGKNGQSYSKWMIHIEYTHPSGHRQTIRKVSPVQTRRGAQAYERELRSALVEGTYNKEKNNTPAQAPVVPTLDAFADEFMNHYAKANNKPSSQQTKASILKHHLLPCFGRMALDQIQVRQIERYKASKLATHSRKTINNHLSVLHKILATAKEWGVLEQAPSMRWLKAPEPDFRFLDFREADRLLAAARLEPRWHAMIMMGLKTGLRLGELLGLPWRHMDLNRGRVQVRQAVSRGEIQTPKNGRTREIPLTPQLVEVLQAHREWNDGRSPFVFCTPEGERLTKNQCKWPLRRARDRAGLQALGWHDLRHTFASHLAMRGVPLRVIQELLGHATLQMTLRYSHLSPSALVEAVSVLDRPQHHDSTTNLSPTKNDR